MDIGIRRLYAQQLLSDSKKTPQKLVSRMGAMQAQDLHMVKWAVGVRIPGSTEAQITKALNTGSILRTHVLRPTWHLVSREDIRWMLELSTPQILTAMRSRHRQLELTPKVVLKCNNIIGKALSVNTELSRKEIVAALEQGGIQTKGDNRAAHILLHAELDGLICSGNCEGKEPSYALLEHRAPRAKPLPREEAITLLTRRYFKSHGPATADDFSWWSGLPKRDVTLGLHLAASGLRSEKINTIEYWMDKATPSAREMSGVFLLPAFDEFLISYKDRSAIMADEQFKRVVSNNGMFWPIVVQNGKITGTWRRSVRKNIAEIEMQYFTKPSVRMRSEVESAAVLFGNFLGKEVEVRHRVV